MCRLTLVITTENNNDNESSLPITDLALPFFPVNPRDLLLHAEAKQGILLEADIEGIEVAETHPTVTSDGRHHSREGFTGSTHFTTHCGQHIGITHAYRQIRDPELHLQALGN